MMSLLRPLLAPHRLRDRISLLVSAVALAAVLLGGLWWGKATRASIHEEVDAAARVAEQWLTVMTREAVINQDSHLLIGRLEAVGRLRANVVEVFDGEGRVLYRSPESLYKAGRSAPAWFAALVEPEFAPRPIPAGDLHLRLKPDASRSVLDAWDTLVQMAGWALAVVVLLGLAIRQAIARALAPLARLEEALAHTADGRFDTRLAHHGVAELDGLAERYNHMAEQLQQTLVHNARLEQDQAFIRAVNARLEEERRGIARELHDEFGQGITAVRAIAGAIAQRSAEQPGLHGSAQAILAMTGQMQDGIRAILERLRRGQAPAAGQIHEALAAYCEHWAGCYPDVALRHDLSPVTEALDEDYCLTLLRLLQESLTNVARHAGARRVEVSLAQEGRELVLTVSDDGRGFDPARPTDRLGLAGMRERVAERHGSLTFQRPEGGGTRVCARLPLPGTGRAGSSSSPGLATLRPRLDRPRQQP
jgi:two-component system, NarL family, sensor histidine kinase UhpB